METETEKCCKNQKLPKKMHEKFNALNKYAFNFGKNCMKGYSLLKGGVEDEWSQKSLLTHSNSLVILHVYLILNK